MALFSMCTGKMSLSLFNKSCGNVTTNFSKHKYQFVFDKSFFPLYCACHLRVCCEREFRQNKRKKTEFPFTSKMARLCAPRDFLATRAQTIAAWMGESNESLCPISQVAHRIARVKVSLLIKSHYKVNRMVYTYTYIV